MREFRAAHNRGGHASQGAQRRGTQEAWTDQEVGLIAPWPGAPAPSRWGLLGSRACSAPLPILEKALSAAMTCVFTSLARQRRFLAAASLEAQLTFFLDFQDGILK